MALTGRTLVRFCGALILGGAASAIDHPAAEPDAVPDRQPAVAAQQAPVPDQAPRGGQVRITPGKRAYALRVSDAASPAGMIQPNSRVDIEVVMADPRDGGKQVSKLFMTDIRVLAMMPTTQLGANGRPIDAAVATLEVTPGEAEALAIAASQGQIRLVLRRQAIPAVSAR